MQVKLREYIRKTRFPINLGKDKKDCPIGEKKEMRKDRRADQIAGSGKTASPCWISRPFPPTGGTNLLIFHLLLCQVFTAPTCNTFETISTIRKHK